MKLSQALGKLKGEWIAFRITAEGADPEGEVGLHETDRATFRKRLRQETVRNVYITFSGELMPDQMQLVGA